MSFYKSPLTDNQQFKLVSNEYLDLLNKNFKDKKTIEYIQFFVIFEHCFYELKRKILASSK